MEETTKPAAAAKTQYKPGDLYNQTFEQVMLGLLNGLTIHRGKVDRVTREDILEIADIAPVTYDQYFQTPEKVMREVTDDIKKIIAQTEAKMELYYEHAVVRNLLDNLSHQPLMLKIILAADDRRIWENNLKNIVRYVATSWSGLEAKLWEELYVVFCFQFHSVLQKWSAAEFSAGARADMVTQVMAWIDADERFAYLVTAPTVKPTPEDQSYDVVG